MSDQTFSFPLLSNDEIVDCMKEIQIPLQAKDLDKPTPFTVRPVYESLCESFMGLTDEDIDALNDQAATNIEYMQVHEESIPQYIFFRQVCQLLYATGVDDFVLSDLINPDPRRFRKHLSAVINFAKFREERFMSFNDISNDTETLIEQKLSIDEECALLQAKISSIHKQREAELPEVEGLQEECRVLESELKHLNKLRSKLTQETNHLKAQRDELKDSIDTLRFQKLNVNQECDRMESNIVRSPERLKRTLAEQRETLKREKQENEKLKDHLMKLANHVSKLENTKMQMTEVSTSMGTAETNIIGCKEAGKQVKRMQTSLREHSNVMRQLQNKKNELERQIQMMEDGSSRLDNAERIKLAAASHAINEAIKERDALQNENIRNKNELDRLQKCISTAESKLASSKSVAKQELEARRTALTRLDNLFESHVARYHEAIAM